MLHLDDFYQQVRAAHLRAAELYQSVRKSFVQEQELLVQGFEELYTALEYLQVAESELRQQRSELAAVREELIVERQRYQNLFELISDAYLATDKKGIIREANCAAATLLNVPQRFLVGKPLAIFISNQERRVFLSEITRLHQQNRRQEWEVRLQPRNGDPIDATLTATTVHDQEGRLLVLHWLLHDTTQRKQANSGLWLLRDVVQQANEAIMITSADLDYPGPRVVFVNPAFTRMTGYTPEEMTGKTPRILQGPKTDRSVLDQLHRNLSQGQIFHGETINYSKDGTEYNVELWCTPIHNERGDITHFVSIQRHIILDNQV